MKKITDNPELITYLRSNVQDAHTRPVLLLLGGGMNMFFGWGAVTVLEQLGLTNFYTIVGVSAGALVGAYFGAGQATVGAALYYEELASRRFVRYLGKNMFDLDYGEALMRSGDYQLNTQAIQSMHSQLYLALTHWSDGKGMLLNAKTPGIDIVTAIKAAVAPPGIYNYPIYPLPGETKRYIDGAIALPFPVQEVMEKFKPTHLVVVANTPLSNLASLPPWSERMFLRCLSVPAHIRQAMMLRYARYKQGCQALARLKTEKFVFAPNKAVHTLTRNNVKLREGFCRSQRIIRNAL